MTDPIEEDSLDDGLGGAGGWVAIVLLALFCLVALYVFAAGLIEVSRGGDVEVTVYAPQAVVPGPARLFAPSEPAAD